MEPSDSTVAPDPKLLAKFEAGIEMFKESPIVAPLFAAHAEKGKKAAGSTGILAKQLGAFIDDQGFFKSDSEKKAFEKELNEITNQPEWLAIFSNPFVSTLMNLLAPLAIKFVNDKLQAKKAKNEGINTDAKTDTV